MKQQLTHVLATLRYTDDDHEKLLQLQAKYTLSGEPNRKADVFRDALRKLYEAEIAPK